MPKAYSDLNFEIQVKFHGKWAPRDWDETLRGAIAGAKMFKTALGVTCRVVDKRTSKVVWK